MDKFIQIFSNTFADWWDILLFVGLSLFHLLAWISIKDKLKEKSKKNSASRELGATFMSTAITSGITAVSILIPASLLIVQLSTQENTTLPEAALFNVFSASIWFFISLSLGLILIFMVPMRVIKHNVARDLPIGVLFGFQLLAILVGMVRFIVGFYYAINL